MISTTHVRLTFLLPGNLLYIVCSFIYYQRLLTHLRRLPQQWRPELSFQHQRWRRRP